MVIEDSFDSGPGQKLVLAGREIHRFLEKLSKTSSGNLWESRQFAAQYGQLISNYGMAFDIPGSFKA